MAQTIRTGVAAQKPPNEVTVASLTFEGDYRLTLLQAISIDRLLDLEGMHEYLIVLNGEDNRALRDRLRNDLVSAVSTELLQRTRFVDARQLSRTVTRDWIGQQVAKLAIVEQISTPHYLMLDAKNHLVRPTSLGEFFRDGVPVNHALDNLEYWQAQVKASLDAMDARTTQNMVRMMQTVTPYVFITDEVERAVTRLECKYGVPLDEALRFTRGTEFFLYWAHLLSTHRTPPYALVPSICATLFTVSPQDSTEVLSVIDRVAGNHLPFFGLHRNRLAQLSERQKNAIRELWLRFLLNRAGDDADWFLESAKLEMPSRSLLQRARGRVARSLQKEALRRRVRRNSRSPEFLTRTLLLERVSRVCREARGMISA